MAAWQVGVALACAAAMFLEDRGRGVAAGRGAVMIGTTRARTPHGFVARRLLTGLCSLATLFTRPRWADG